MEIAGNSGADEGKGASASVTFRFKVDDPMGAVRMTHYSKWTDPRATRYAQYKRRVRLIANVAGVPSEIRKDERVKAVVDVCWKGAAKVDIDNVLKGILDALWKQDRRVNSIEATHVEDCEADFAEVEITISSKESP